LGSYGFETGHFNVGHASFIKTSSNKTLTQRDFCTFAQLPGYRARAPGCCENSSLPENLSSL
jgi:hypothetical protein